MIQRFLLKRLDAVERQLGESVDYIRQIVRVSLRAVVDKKPEQFPADGTGGGCDSAGLARGGGYGEG